MRFILMLLVIVVIVAIVGLWTGMLDITQTRHGALPSIAVSGGAAPAFDVKTANVSITNETHTVTVPRIAVRKPQ